jgi:hypothetical protein
MAGEAGTSSTPMAARVCEPFDVAEHAIGTSLLEASAPPTPLAPLRLTKNDDEPTGTGRIERNHCRQRHWFGRFKRKSIIVSKSKEMVDLTIALFAKFWVNGTQDKLISLLC